MNDAIVLALIGIMAAPIASFVTWMFNRKKTVADMYSVFTESSQRAVETMQSAMETLHEELGAAQLKIDALMNENKKMRQELALLREQNNRLIDENVLLSNKLDELSKSLRDRQDSP